MIPRLHIAVLQAGKKEFRFFAAAIAIVMIIMAAGGAVNIDEILHNGQAKKNLNWYKTMGDDKSCLDTPVSNLKYYGQFPDNFSALINDMLGLKNEYLTRHVIGFFFGFLLIIFTGLIAVEISGNYFAGILAMILIFISPRPMGQAFGNLKDIPFAMGYAWSLLLTLRLFKDMPHPKWKTIVILGLAIALTNAVRIGGLVFFPYLFLFLLSWMFIFHKKYLQIRDKIAWWKTIFMMGLTILMTGYFAGLIFWPFGLVNPLKNPLEALSVMEQYKISIKQIFEGSQTWSTSLPGHYLPEWLIISIPEIVIAGVLIFGILFYNRFHSMDRLAYFRTAILLFAFLFPFLYVIAIDSNLYSGWRQMYFIYSPIIVVAALGLDQLLRNLNPTGFIAVSALALILTAMPVVHTIQTYPSEYIYFNALSGGNKKSWSNYEYDYYWHEMKKAAGWLKNELKSEEESVKIASNFDIRSYLYNQTIDFKYVHFYDKISVEWDYAILGVNYVHPWQLKNNTWQPEGTIKTFYHKGNPTVIILKGQNKNARQGYLAFQQKNFNTAAVLLAKAHEYDPFDLNVLAYLGESQLALENYDEVKKVIAAGKLNHPEYEPFLLLNAKLEMKQENFSRGLESLQALIKINPRYFKALPYLIECYQKTGQPEKALKLKEKYNV